MVGGCGAAIGWTLKVVTDDDRDDTWAGPDPFLVVTDTNDPTDARDILDRVLTVDSAERTRPALHSLQAAGGVPAVWA